MIGSRIAMLTILALGSGTTTAPQQGGRRADSRETWVTPEQEVNDCDWYRTADPKYWSDEQKAAAERRCRMVEEWRAFVTERQRCSSDRDCVLVASNCPFGCVNVPVAATHAKAVIGKQDELRKKLGRDCKSRCRPVTRALCEEGWCVAGWSIRTDSEHAR